MVVLIINSTPDKKRKHGCTYKAYLITIKILLTDSQLIECGYHLSGLYFHSGLATVPCVHSMQHLNSCKVNINK